MLDKKQLPRVVIEEALCRQSIKQTRAMLGKLEKKVQLTLEEMRAQDFSEDTAPEEEEWKEF